MAFNTFVDRVVQYPGRVIMTPVAGEANTYDMSRAEGNVTEEGTPFNAETFNGIADEIIQTADDNIITSGELSTLAAKVGISTASLYNILYEIGNRGTFQQADWTATSSSAIFTRVTDKISVPKGVYVVTLKLPVIQGDGSVWHGIGGVNDDVVYAAELKSQGMFTCTIKTDAPTDLYGETRQSASITYNPTYLNRGKLTVTRVG